MDAILLAAGNSLRFGGNKLLYSLAGKPVYRYILERLSQKKKERALENVIVVSHYREIFEDMRENFPELAPVYNPEPQRGISSSIRLGLLRLERLTGDSQACLFAVADQPGLTGRSIGELIHFWQRHSFGIVAASCGEMIGNPVIFSARYYPELKALAKDCGGKEIRMRHQEDTGFCEILAADLEDMDTREEAARFQERMGSDMEVRFPFLREKGHVLSIVGAGGKSSLMDALAGHYANRGRRVVVSTTTHILRPREGYVAGNREELKRFLRSHRIVTAGTDAPEGKLAAADSMTVEDYRELADVVLIEADGAKHFPCKVPKEREPVIPRESDIVLGVLGMDALGKCLKDVCFRWQRAMDFLGVDANHRMTQRDLVKILAADWGTRKGVGDREYYVVLNQCDDEKRMEQAKAMERMLKDAGVEHVVCISLKKEKKNSL